MVMSGANFGNDESYIDSPVGLQWLLQASIRIPGVVVSRMSDGEMAASCVVSGVSGPQNLLDSQTANQFRVERQGSVELGQVHGKFGEQASRRVIFSACNPAAQATTAALATTYTGLCLSNPANSQKNLVVLKVSWVPTAVPSTLVQTGLMGGFGTVTHTTPRIIHSNVLDTAMTASDNFSVALVDSAATIPTPVLLQPMANANANNTLPVSSADMTEQAEGTFVVGPGAFIAIYTLTAGTGIGFFAWEEIPLWN